MNKLAKQLQQAFYLSLHGEGWEDKIRVVGDPNCLYGNCWQVFLGFPVNAEMLLEVLGNQYACGNNRIVRVVATCEEYLCEVYSVCDWISNTPLHLQSEKTQKIMLKLILKK